jgi:hypothetical protein
MVFQLAACPVIADLACKRANTTSQRARRNIFKAKMICIFYRQGLSAEELEADGANETLVEIRHCTNPGILFDVLQVTRKQLEQLSTSSIPRRFL